MMLQCRAKEKDMAELFGKNIQTEPVLRGCASEKPFFP